MVTHVKIDASQQLGVRFESVFSINIEVDRSRLVNAEFVNAITLTTRLAFNVLKSEAAVFPQFNHNLTNVGLYVLYGSSFAFDGVNSPAEALPYIADYQGL